MSERVIVKSDSNTDWVLYRMNGKGIYYFIFSPSHPDGLSPMLHLSAISNNFLKCQSIACSMYDAFISQIKKGRG